MRAYAVATGAHVFTLIGHAADVTGVVQHPTNHKQVVTASLDGSLRFWDADDGSALRTLPLGAPVVRLAAPELWPSGALPRLYAVLLGSDGASSGGSSSTEVVVVDYPTGDETACLRPRPLATAFAATVDANGRRRSAPRCTLVEIFPAAAPTPTARVIFSKTGFFTGLAAMCLGSTSASSSGGMAGVETGGARGVVSDVAVAFTCRRKLFVWRSGVEAGTSLTQYEHKELLTTVRRQSGMCGALGRYYWRLTGVATHGFNHCAGLLFGQHLTLVLFSYVLSHARTRPPPTHPPLHAAVAAPQRDAWGVLRVHRRHLWPPADVVCARTNR